MSELCFWVSAAILAYTFGGFAMLMRLLGRRETARACAGASEQPRVAIVLVVHNEAIRVLQRVRNLLEQDYPPALRQVIVVSDGSTDETHAILSGFEPTELLLIQRPERAGKAACINAALASSQAQRAELIVFADARQRFHPAVLRRLAARFAEPTVGAVSGALEIEPAASGVGRAVDAYWRHEKALREAESNYDSCIGCTGAVYAIRRSLFTPIPADTLLDDVVIPMQIAMRGYRVGFESAALALDPQSLEPAKESVRKRRTLAGNFQMLFRYPGWLLPWRNRLWWQLLSHKYLRLIAPAFLLLAWISSGMLFANPFYRLAFILQTTLYCLGIIGALCPSLRHPLVSIPAGFLFLNASTVRAFWHYATHSDLHRWQKPS